MLLAEDPLDLLLDRLRALSPGDRRAVLARLSPAERRRVEAALRAPAETAPTHAEDIAARIAAPAGDPAMTAAGREALARVAGRTVTSPVAGPAPSLFGRLGGAMGRR